MRKFIGYIPAALFTGFYLFSGLTGASIAMSMVLVWLICFWLLFVTCGADQQIDNAE